MKLDYTPFMQRPPGLISRLLSSAYAPLLANLPEYRAEELRRTWQEYDAAVHAAPDTIGSCGFFSCLGTEVVGLGSWDPRGWPEVGIIGHNCVLPPYQCQRYGQCQIREILRRLNDAGFERVIARTDEHPFFEPARRMYLSCNFRESRRYPGELMQPYFMIEYERTL